MSSGKKKRPQKRVYSESECKRAVRSAVDDAVKKLLLMYITAIAEKYKPSEDELVEMLETMQRYQRYEEQGLVPLKKYSEILLKHGIDLRLSRW